MKLHEYQAKEILKAQGIPVPQGKVVDNLADGLSSGESLGFPLAIKAQVYAGGRGKAGAIRIVSDREELQKGLTEILGMKVKGLCVKKVLIEKGLDIKEQFYLSITVDRARQSNVIMVSDAGGIDIEETAKAHPEKIMKEVLKAPHILEAAVVRKLISFLLLPDDLCALFAEIVRGLFNVYLKSDAEIAEINPLILTGGNLFIACDAKIIIDDNALFRHRDLEALKEESEENELEKEAHRRNLAYVKLPGNIGIIGNGAGLVMATMDEVQRMGGRPANFLDIGGGAKREVVENALEVLAMDKEIGGIFINIFGGITRCDEVARGIIQITKERPFGVPVVLRLTGTQCEEGRRLLEKSSLVSAGSMEEGAKKIVALVR
ncbi:MAG: ADP-forming succinate--CoA ligase subunit beta [Candidatus Omnitrophota bacterium]|nr:ADP-forming succinate--CoA ligase subunit beta [Candidatus Omnitrophota bacterium]